MIRGRRLSVARQPSGLAGKGPQAATTSGYGIRTTLRRAMQLHQRLRLRKGVSISAQVSNATRVYLGGDRPLIVFQDREQVLEKIQRLPV